MGHISVAVIHRPTQRIENLMDEYYGSVWDYYDVVDDIMVNKKGKPCSSCRIKDVNMRMIRKKYHEALLEWDYNVLHLNNGFTGKTYFNPEYYIDRYGTRTNFARQMSTFCTNAVVLPDGTWNELTDWSFEALNDWHLHFKERFIDTANPEWIITTLDVHV